MHYSDAEMREPFRAGWMGVKRQARPARGTALALRDTRGSQMMLLHDTNGQNGLETAAALVGGTPKDNLVNPFYKLYCTYV